MKRFSALLLALLLICLAVPFAGVSAAEQKQLWVTHYNDIYAEGSGVIFTTSYSDCIWHDHYAFAPVEGKEGVFELVKTSFGVGTGEGKVLPIPTGGFVYVLNSGNDYPALFQQDPVANKWCDGKPDYTNDGVDAAIQQAKTWTVGDRFVFNGIDLVGLTVPTSTPDLEWYDDAYVCTATYADYEENAAVSDTTTEDPASADADDETTPAESSVEDNDGNGLETVLWVIASVAVIAVVAVVIVLVLKKKK